MDPASHAPAAWSDTQDSLDAATLATCYRSGALRPTDVVRVVYARIRACKAPGIWITCVPEADALAVAAALEAQSPPRLGPDRLPLYGLPFGVKDNIDAAGLPTTAACPDFAYTPAESAPSVAACVAAGAILIGKTNLDQFATGLVGTRSPYGACSSAFDERYISGGSSSGSAVAVARGMATFALGTDTGGSGRIPAGYNNVVGLKPTRDLISTAGLVPACRSLDCVSVFALYATDARLVLEAMRRDERAQGARARNTAGLPEGEWSSGASFRFGILAERDREFFGYHESAGPYAHAIDRFAALGGIPVEIDFSPFREAGQLMFSGPWIAERYADLADFIAAHPTGVLPLTRDIIKSGARFSAADVFRAQHRLRTLTEQTQAALAPLAFFMVPTAARPYTHAEVAADPLATNNRVGHYSYFVNLLDLCAHAVPNGFLGNGMPTGLTLIAPPLHDDALAAVAAAYQEQLGMPPGAAA